MKFIHVLSLLKFNTARLHILQWFLILQLYLLAYYLKKMIVHLSLCSVQINIFNCTHKGSQKRETEHL